ncbi:hypothetical protein TWF106_006464 [Orbilia oligospora]|uniref:Uncharacterized protein n=1 Tax=Orbilia oligospora TaxID=2813651 RepID=A0A7C8UT37_ORBOL|nr:hypothetical protein TWF106_006464 [Orbilia oligospora]
MNFSNVSFELQPPNFRRGIQEIPSCSDQASGMAQQTSEDAEPSIKLQHTNSNIENCLRNMSDYWNYDQNHPARNSCAVLSYCVVSGNIKCFGCLALLPVPKTKRTGEPETECSGGPVLSVVVSPFCRDVSKYDVDKLDEHIRVIKGDPMTLEEIIVPNNFGFASYSESSSVQAKWPSLTSFLQLRIEAHIPTYIKAWWKKLGQTPVVPNMRLCSTVLPFLEDAGGNDKLAWGKVQRIELENVNLVSDKKHFKECMTAATGLRVVSLLHTDATRFGYHCLLSLIPTSCERIFIIDACTKEIEGTHGLYSLPSIGEHLARFPSLQAVKLPGHIILEAINFKSLPDTLQSIFATHCSLDMGAKIQDYYKDSGTEVTFSECECMLSRDSATISDAQITAEQYLSELEPVPIISDICYSDDGAGGWAFCRDIPPGAKGPDISPSGEADEYTEKMESNTEIGWFYHTES